MQITNLVFSYTNLNLFFRCFQFFCTYFFLTFSFFFFKKEKIRTLLNFKDITVAVTGYRQSKPGALLIQFNSKSFSVNKNLHYLNITKFFFLKYKSNIKVSLDDSNSIIIVLNSKVLYLNCKILFSVTFRFHLYHFLRIFQWSCWIIDLYYVFFCFCTEITSYYD